MHIIHSPPEIVERLAPLTTGLVLAPECSSTPGRVTAIVSNRFKCLWSSFNVHSLHRNTEKIEHLHWFWDSSNSPKRGYTPNHMLHFGTDPSGDSCHHVPSFTSRSSEMLLWCLFNIVTWGRKGRAAACCGRTNQTQWITMIWRPFLDFTGLRDLKSWLQMHGIPVQGIQGCPWNFESWGWLGGLGLWDGSKKCFDSIPSIFMGSQACSLKGWKSLKMERDPNQILTGADFWIWCDDMFDLHQASDALHNLSRYTN